MAFGLWTLDVDLVLGIQVKVFAKGFWALDLGLCVIGFLFRALDFELLKSRRWILVFGLQDLSSWTRVSWFLDCAFGILDFGFWALDFGLWI